MKNIDKLEASLDYHFEDPQLLIEALTHKSYKQPYNNERLEFLGDAVLGMIIADKLFQFKDDMVAQVEEKAKKISSNS